MNAQPDSNPRTSTIRRGLLSWGVMIVAVVVVGLSLTMPAALRDLGMGPVAATSVCMIAIALLIGRYSTALGLYPIPVLGPESKPDALSVSAAVLGGASLWLMGAVVARVLITDDRNAVGLGTTDPYLLTLLFILVIAPVTEEILYRGLLQGALNRVFPVAISVLLTSLIFALAHPRPRDMMLALAIGLLAGVLREVSGTMWMPILAHVAMNTASWLVPAAAVSHLAHSGASLPVLVLLGGAATVAVVVLVARSPAGVSRLRRDSLT